MKTGVLSTLGQFNQSVCVCGGGGVLSALGQFNQWGGGGAVHVQLSLCLKTGRVPSTYMAILETTLLPVCFKLTLD